MATPEPEPGDPTGGPDSGVAWVRAELQTPTLSALREVMTVGNQVGPVIARRAGLSHSELDALERLAERPYGPAELAKQLGVTTAAGTQIVDRLVARGHATRRKHESDRRRTEVVISDSGRAEVVGHLMPMFAALGRLDAALTPQEAQVVTRYLQGAVESMKALL
ncbi:DNA-binding MarR family transcriptional regulator [Kineosphaera limosa]|uniref:Putative MarR family transcriptional regulator n=1 Tax=Kineosphaera limosa NBRC 100340 TaxID=1184609 RepID=K6X7D1_9MICO|nr:MarR family transcriptional regulator [Kineosphaera limosa]NYD99329.1 DNA-binding MarR family transcriptional regulator [Kineosphaera limosa]GAB94714.1 putative MarR family transcriptional regulator [Kineosphaera limosa NBRC 100340]